MKCILAKLRIVRLLKCFMITISTLLLLTVIGVTGTATAVAAEWVTNQTNPVDPTSYSDIVRITQQQQRFIRQLQTKNDDRDDTTTTLPPLTNNTKNRNKKTNEISTTSGSDSSNSSVGATNNDDVSPDTILITVSLLNTLFFVIPTTIRYAIEKRQCLRNSNDDDSSSRCICTYPQLINAIERSTTNSNNNTIPVIVLCPAITIEFTQAINITNHTFRLTCGTSRFINTGPCILTTTTATGSTNFFIGSPIDVTIQDITIQNGGKPNNNDNGGGGGGSAIEIDADGRRGGKLTLQNVIIQNNILSQRRGGAIYVTFSSSSSIIATTPSPSIVIQIRGRTIFRNNQVVVVDDSDDIRTYNDIYIVPKKDLFGRPISISNNTNVYVECIPTTLLDRPTFCNYNDNINTTSIIIEGITNLTERMQYTNCDNSNKIDSSC